MATDQQDGRDWSKSAKGWGVFLLFFVGWGIIMTESQQIGIGATLMFVSLVFMIRIRDGEI